MLLDNTSVLKAKSKAGNIPLRHLWAKFSDAEIKQLTEEAAIGPIQPTLPPKALQVWDLVELLLRTSHYGRVVPEQDDEPEEDRFRLLHALAQEDHPHLSLVQLAIKISPPGQIREGDARGRRPLHIAIRAGVRWDDSLMENIFRAAPDVAGIPDDDGRFPLHHGIVAGMEWTDGLQEIVGAAPVALDYGDRLTGLAPFQLAASHETASLDTTYLLLQANPELVRMALD